MQENLKKFKASRKLHKGRATSLRKSTKNLMCNKGSRTLIKNNAEKIRELLGTLGKIQNQILEVVSELDKPEEGEEAEDWLQQVLAENHELLELVDDHLADRADETPSVALSMAGSDAPSEESEDSLMRREVQEEASSAKQRLEAQLAQWELLISQLSVATRQENPQEELDEMMKRLDAMTWSVNGSWAKVLQLCSTQEAVDLREEIYFVRDNYRRCQKRVGPALKPLPEGMDSGKEKTQSKDWARISPNRPKDMVREYLMTAGLDLDKDGAKILVKQMVSKLPRDERGKWEDNACELPRIGLPDYTQWLERRVRFHRKMLQQDKRAQPGPPGQRYARYASSSSADSSNKGQGKAKSAHTAQAAKDRTQPATPTPTPCSNCHEPGHNIQKCDKMRVAEAQLCFNCLSKGHQARLCRRSTFCSVTDNGRRHHPLVHSERRNEQSEVGGAPAATVATVATAAISPNRRPIAFSMLKATLMGHNGMSSEALVFVDPGSDVTLVSSKLRKALQLKKGRSSVSVPLSTVGGEKWTVRMAEYQLRIRSHLSCSGRVFPLVATEIEGRKLTNELTGAQWTIINDRYPHLRDLPLQDVGGEPDLLLGLDHVELLAPREVRMGRQGEPIAEKNLLGWAAKGPIVGRASSPAGIADSQGTVSVHFLMAEEEHRLAHRFFDGEALGTEVKPQPLWSNEDQVVLGHLEKNIQKLDGQPGSMTPGGAVGKQLASGRTEMDALETEAL
eukprot:TCALIF_13829-PA protein Name:"Protein of unknown function" AED:0.11 eAED:0.18 QI:61/0/0/1/0/0/4/0/733